MITMPDMAYVSAFMDNDLTHIKLQESVDLSVLNPWNLQWVTHLLIKRPQVK